MDKAKAFFNSAKAAAAAGGGKMPAGGGPGGKALGALVGIALTSYVGYNSLVTLPPGHMGMKYNRIGGLEEVASLHEGLNIVIPWFQRTVVYDVRTRPQKITTQSGSKDLQFIEIEIRLLYRPNQHQLPALFRLLGKDFDQRVLPSIVNEVAKAVIAQYNASELINKREEVSKQIAMALAKKGEKFHIKFDDVSIIHFGFSKEYTAAVEAKQVAIQDSERAKHIVDRAYFIKQQVIIKAQGEAEAAEMIGRAARDSPAYVELRKIDAMRDIALVLANSQNKVYLNADGLLLNSLADKTKAPEPVKKSWF